MRRLRWVVRIVAVLGVLVCALVLGAVHLLNSEPFARWLLETAAARSNGVVAIQSVAGTLDGGVRIGRLDIDLPDVGARLSGVDASLDWRSLIARSVVLESLSVARIEAELRQPEPQDSAGEMRPGEFSMLVLVRELRIGEIEIAADEQRYAISDTSMELRALRNRFEVSALATSYEDLRLTGNAAMTIADELLIDGDLCIDGVMAGENVRGCVEFEGLPEALNADAQLQLPFPVAAAGTFELAETGAVELTASWENASLSALPDVASGRGTLQVAGTYVNPQIAAEGSVLYQGQEALFSVNMAVADDVFDIVRLRLEQGLLSAEITGALDRDFASANGSVELTNFDLQRLAEGLPPGSFDLRGQVFVGLQPSLEIAATDLIVSGQLRDAPVVATGDVSYANDSLIIDALQVVSRSDRIEMSGRISDSLEIDVVASMADIGLVLPDFSGALSAEARITGSPSQPFARGVVSIEDLSSSDFSVQSLQVTGSAGLAPEDALELAASAAGAEVYGAAVSDAVVTLTGTAAAHRLDVRVSAEDWSAGLGADGALLDGNWQGRLDALEVTPGEFGLWQLITPVNVSYGVAGYSVEELCLAYTLSRICAAVSVAGLPADSLQVAVTNFDSRILAPFMPAGIQARGLVNGRGVIADFVSDPIGEFELETADAQVDVVLGEGEILPVPIRQLRLGALFDDVGATLSGTLDAAEMGNATVAFALGDPRSANPGLRGTVTVQWRDAAALAMLSPDIENVNGQIDGQMQIGGTLYAPVVSGTAGLTDGALEIPLWGLTIEQLVATATASESREALFEATGMIDGKPVNVDGTLFLDPRRGWPMQLRLSGENLSIVQLADLQMQVSPQLEANVLLPRVEVTGVVSLPSAQFRDVALPQQAVFPSTDAVIRGRTIEERARPLDVTAALTLELGDDVRYVDANVNAMVKGRLDLDYRSGQGAAVVGSLMLSGEYIAYGNPLSLERGQLIFVGPWNDPSLDIRAQREIGEVIAGVQVGGTLRTPVTNVFSVPVMSEADALSWLLFGRPLDDVRESDSNALRGAALAMGVQQALPAIDRFGESIGLDEFAIRNTEADASEIMAGKYLSPNVYFRYSYGVFNRIGGILLRYRINDRFSLETRSGEYNSMDFFYTREKE